MKYVALESPSSAKGSIEEPGRNVAAKAGLNLALLDAGFDMIAQLIAEKAESAAREVIYLDPKYTSQMCAACPRRSRGRHRPKNRAIAE